MAKTSTAKEKRRSERMRRNDELNGIAWRARGGSKEEGEKLGIMTDLFPEQMSEIEKQQAALLLKARKHMHDLKDSQDEVLRLWKSDQKSAKALGEALIEVQKKMAGLKRGSFKKWWMSEELDKNRVSYCMRLASPAGNKVQEAADKRKRTARAVAFGMVNDKLETLWALVQSGDEMKAADELLTDIIELIRAKFLAAKPKADAAHA